MALIWHRVEAGHYRSECGRYTIVRSVPREFNPHPWTVETTDRILSHFSSQAGAKEWAEFEEHRKEARTYVFKPIPQALRDALEKQDELLREPKYVDMSKREEEFLRIKGLKPKPKAKLKGGLEPIKRR